jgi:hypothetical protein
VLEWIKKVLGWERIMAQNICWLWKNLLTCRIHSDLKFNALARMPGICSIFCRGRSEILAMVMAYIIVN